MDTLDDRAMISSLDFMVAIVLVMAAVMLAILIMPSMSHEDKSWRIKQYMSATRASDNLVQDEGQEGWVTNWTNPKYLNVTKIGFVHDQPKVLDEIKINTTMARNVDVITGLPWWEFPNFSKPTNEQKIELENATRALGLDGYNLYMRLYPVGLNSSKFNYSRVEINLSDRSKVPMIENTASVVDRYIYINSTDPLCNGYICYDNKTIHYRLNVWVW
jgi:hypothetical protein